MRLHGFQGMVIRNHAIYLVAIITVEGEVDLWPHGTNFRTAAYCLN